MKSPEVIVKIDDDFPNKPTTNLSRTSSSKGLAHRDSSKDIRRDNTSLGGSGEFSFNSRAGDAPEESPSARIVAGKLFQRKRSISGDSFLVEGTSDVDTPETDESRQQRPSDSASTAAHPPSSSSASVSASGLPPLPLTNTIRQSPSFSRGPSPAPSPISRTNSIFNDASREIRVSFKESTVPHASRRRTTTYNDLGEITTSSDSSDAVGDDRDDEGDPLDDERSIRRQSRRFQSKRDNAEVLRCTSNAAFSRAPTLSRVRTRSRMMDPPPERSPIGVGKSGAISVRSGYLPSGMLSTKPDGEDEEDDPFSDEDLPEDFKNESVSLLVIMEWLSLILLSAALVWSLVIPELKQKELWKMELWKWEVLVLVLICGRLVSGWGIKVMVFFIERNFVLRKRVLYFVYGIKTAVRNCIWLSLVLTTWQYLFDERVEREANTELLRYVTKIIICFLVSSIVWLFKTLAVKVMASSFHVNAFFDRIQESLFNQFVIKTLSGPPLYEIHRTGIEEDRTLAEVQRLQNAGAMIPPDLRANVLPQSRSSRSLMSGRIRASGQIPPRSPNVGHSSRLTEPISGKQDVQGEITIDHLHKMNQKNVSAWNMKRLMKIIRKGALTTLDEQILDSSNDDEHAKQIRSEVEAKAAARNIFRNVSRPHCRYIYFEDLLRFMEEEEAMKTMSLFEGASENERISKSALKNWVVNAFRERRALALTLNDTKTAVDNLHRIINVLVTLIIILIWLIILEIATSKFLLFATSQVVLVAFMFGNSCKNVFESIIFLFVVHPFDVGDRCEIDGIQMIVEEMNILTTVFLRYDNQKIIYPNSLLIAKPIHNFYRSPEMGDAVEFCFHILTPPEKITQVRQRILSYIENKKEHWFPNPMIILKDVENLNVLRIAIWLQHRMNHQDMGERWGRRALLVEECVKIFRELDIEYRFLPWNINVKTLPPCPVPNWPGGTAAAPSPSPLPHESWPATGSPRADSKDVVHR